MPTIGCNTAGQTVGIYAHSACLGDDQIVYANQRHKVSHSDMFLGVYVWHVSHVRICVRSCISLCSLTHIYVLLYTLT
jgi:hypothetical protein